jgi:hypothetical protein
MSEEPPTPRSCLVGVLDIEYGGLLWGIDECMTGKAYRLGRGHVFWMGASKNRQQFNSVFFFLAGFLVGGASISSAGFAAMRARP